VLLVGDDWAEDHHDVEVVDDDGQVLARRGLPNGLEGIAVLHAVIGEHLPEGWADWEPAFGRIGGGAEPTDDIGAGRLLKS
jgi:hypothetical protein